MNRIPCVIKAESRGGHRIHVTFDDNSEKTIDSRRWLAIAGDSNGGPLVGAQVTR